MATPVVFLPAAIEDLRRAQRYYEQKQASLGELFRLEVDRTLGVIEYWPHSYERVNATLRRAFVQRFPYAIIYRPLENSIRVVGILATQQNPSSIAERGAAADRN